MKVINMRQTGSYVIYSVGLDQTSNEMWRVFCCDIEMEFNCSCMRIESFGIPWEYIVCVLVHEDIEELPRSLVLLQWTKTIKLEGRGIDTFDNDFDDHMNIEDDSLVYDENASYSSNKVL
ncbi:hypothetical protein Ahy_A07g037269 [Arachis hypogaea]|uniref:Uncharacterized protein n=1 Tax=Arachis hypogaea TaxID=3818 RepID=A0A445CI89_ARAHY|nr:hypothetical protein Ahy_A07g037269 [Arachis hypogaea]